MEHLASARFGVDEETTENLCKEIDEKVDAYANGNLEYAAEVLSLLWKFSRKRDPMPPAPFPTPQSGSMIPIPVFPPPHSRPRSCSPDPPARPSNVEIAFIRSIRGGVFADRKYWAQHSRSGAALRPVYLSSLAAGRWSPDIENRKWLYPTSLGYVDSWFGSRKANERG